MSLKCKCDKCNSDVDSNTWGDVLVCYDCYETEIEARDGEITDLKKEVEDLQEEIQNIQTYKEN